MARLMSAATADVVGMHKAWLFAFEGSANQTGYFSVVKFIHEDSSRTCDAYCHELRRAPKEQLPPVDADHNQISKRMLIIGSDEVQSGK